MAGLLNIPKLVDYRNKVKRHPYNKFPVRNLSQKNTIAIHHSLTKQGLSGSNAEGYARYHVDKHGWPSIGYSYVIEPDGTIKFCNDIELRTYHVGNHNDYAIGICLTGDFRYEEPTEEQKESLRNLVNGLKKAYSHIKYVKGHNEFSGYEWKQCPVFDYKEVLAEKGTAPKPVDLPSTYVIQEGDTLWSIAKGLDGITVDDLIKSNPKIDPTKLQVGQKISLGKVKEDVQHVSNPVKPKPQPKPSKKKQPDMKTNSIVTYLNSIGEDSSYGNRAKLAAKYKIKNYKGTESQNLLLLSILRDGKKVTATKPKPKKSINQMAQEIIDNKHGNGHENRRKSLGISKSEYEKVRSEVNRILNGKSNPPKPKKTIAQMANEVILGKHGSGHENRRKSLGISKAEYEKVRAEVNRRL